MQRFEADYFDGRSSRRHVVEVVVAEGRAVVRGAEVLLELAVADLKVQPRIGRTPYAIKLPDGGLLITQAELESILPVPRASGLAHRLESNLRIVLASLVGLAIAVWFGYRDGIPWLARTVALHVPPEVERDIAVEGLKALDGYVFKPTALEAARREKLTATFHQLSAGGAVPARLEFRDGTFIGANAFALPGGVVVMTDQLADVIPDDDKVAAVLAHEIGHLEARHGMRHILQDSITALFATAVLGDMSAVSSLAATLPTLVMHTTNSREFEREADRFAYGLLRKTGRSPALLGQALTDLEATRRQQRGNQGCKVPLDKKDGEDETAAAKPENAEKADKADKADDRKSINFGYLSTHPSTADRVREAEEAAR